MSLSYLFNRTNLANHLKKSWLIRLFLKAWLAILIAIMPFLLTFGQDHTPPSDSSSVAFLPAVSYTTEVGLAAGGVFNRISYGSTQPFEQNIALTALASTKGLIGFNLFLDQPNTFLNKDRLSVNLVTNRFLEDQYYGVYNTAQIELNKQNKEYLYQSLTFKINLEYLFSFKEWLYYARSKSPIDPDVRSVKAIDRSKSPGLLWLTSIDYHYKTPWDNNENSFIMRDKPVGIQGAKALWLGLGGMVDARNHEFYPTKGWYSKLLLKTTVPYLSTDFTQQLISSEWRFYTSFQLFLDVVLAQRLYYEWSSNNKQLPYWAYPELGGEDYLRGFATYRFLANQVWATNTELRTWLIDLEQLGIRIGGTLFADLGSFSNQAFSTDEWNNNLSYTFGFGGLASFFSPDFILRADMGFSKEGIGIYLSTGILF